MATLGVSEEEAIVATNNDATSCKRYATEKGYWKDEFIKYFYKTVERKSPEISRGYYARVMSVHSLLKQFITLTRMAGLKSQVISLGAGYDTTYWQLHSVELQPTCYFEVDLAAVTSRKCHYIRSRLQLMDALQSTAEPSFSKDEIHSVPYHLITADLRNVDELDKKLLAAGIDQEIPTMLIAECVLVYIEPNLSSALINWAGKSFSTALFVNYEPFNANDAFGEVMKKNIKQQRYLTNGWSGSWAVDMDTVYRQLLPADEISRIEKLEFLDEGGLLIQLLRHYCVSVGYNDKSNIGLAGMSIKEAAQR